MNKVKILNAEVGALTMNETLQLVMYSIQAKKKISHIVVNAGKLVSLQEDQKLYKSVEEADIVNADGQAVVWASHLLGSPLPERVAGIDLMESLVKMASEKGLSCFFFGAKEEVVRKVVVKYSNLFSPAVVAGYRNGYYLPEEEESIAHSIVECKPDILFVAISSPKKEIFLNTNREILDIPFTMGVGGSFDVVAGITKRAPVWMQKVGLEWFYRFVQEPKRMWKRYLVGNSLFVYYIIKQKLGLYKNPFE